ncbi:hypothetical protein SAMN04488540_101413 [Ferrimonas sediminum]|uniref:Beta-barrel porin 2 n=2 Tax=Ferrimonas sediminum TaxID=718193 RepID=A0A1G8KL63_9GAMM|nr:hypothetical protein SAMN04488540_101413 [Ferrimonas sediminum]
MLGWGCRIGVMMLLLGAPGWGAATETPAPEQEAEPDRPELDQELRWFDKAHTLLSGSAQSSALWFDDFFGPSDDADQASSHFRLRLQQEFVEREEDELRLRVSASYYLPKTSKRLKLLLESDEQDDLSQVSDSLGADAEATTRAALRWIPINLDSWDLSVDLGASLSSGLNPFLRSRARYFESVNDNTLLKLSQEVRVESNDGWSETSRLNLERVYDDHVYRWQNRARFGEETEGLEWVTSLSRIQWLDDKTAFSTFIAASGATRDDGDESEIRRLGFTFRRNFARDWLFYEVEPQLTWPRKYGFDTNIELQLTLEAQFGERRR